MLTLVLAVALVGCQSDEARLSGEAHLSRDDAERAQNEAGVRIYWLGESFEGLPLTRADVDGPRRAALTYGECDGESEGFDSFRCTGPQIQIQHFPFTAVGWRIASGCRTLPTVRGVPTLRHDGLVLVTGDGIVKVYARNAAQDLRVARSVTPINDPVSRLPPPTPRQRRIVAAACPA